MNILGTILVSTFVTCVIVAIICIYLLTSKK